MGGWADGKRSKNLLHVCIAMDLDSKVEEAWGGRRAQATRGQ